MLIHVKRKTFLCHKLRALVSTHLVLQDNLARLHDSYQKNLEDTKGHPGSITIGTYGEFSKERTVGRSVKEVFCNGMVSAPPFPGHFRGVAGCIGALRKVRPDNPLPFASFPFSPPPPLLTL